MRMNKRPTSRMTMRKKKIEGRSNRKNRSQVMETSIGARKTVIKSCASIVEHKITIKYVEN